PSEGTEATALVGRDELLRTLIAWTHAPRGAFGLIVGTPALGKSALLGHLAAQGGGLGPVRIDARATDAEMLAALLRVLAAEGGDAALVSSLRRAGHDADRLASYVGLVRPEGAARAAPPPEAIADAVTAVATRLHPTPPLVLVDDLQLASALVLECLR